MRNQVYRSVDCPLCGYTVHLCFWTDSELKNRGESLGFCEMCESYLNFREVDGELTLSEDFEDDETTISA